MKCLANTVSCPGSNYPVKEHWLCTFCLLDITSDLAISQYRRYSELPCKTVELVQKSATLHIPVPTSSYFLHLLHLHTSFKLSSLQAKFTKPSSQKIGNPSHSRFKTFPLTHGDGQEWLDVSRVPVGMSIHRSKQNAKRLPIRENFCFTLVRKSVAKN